MSEVLLSDVMCEYRMVCRALVEGICGFGTL